MSKENPCATTCECGEKPPKNTNSGSAPLEINGFKSKNLPEPTRFGDWEVGGRCSDF